MNAVDNIVECRGLIALSLAEHLPADAPEKIVEAVADMEEARKNLGEKIERVRQLMLPNSSR